MCLLYKDGAFCGTIYHCPSYTLCYRNNELKFLGYTMLFQAYMLLTEPGRSSLSHFSYLQPHESSFIFEVSYCLLQEATSVSPSSQSLSHFLLYKICTLQIMKICALTLYFWLVSMALSYKKLWASQGQKLCFTPSLCLQLNIVMNS